MIMSSNKFARYARLLVAGVALAACAGSAGCAAEAAPTVAQADVGPGIAQVQRSVHFDLADLPGSGSYALEINGRSYALAAHTAESLTAYRGQLRAQGRASSTTPTHFVPTASFSKDGPQIFRVVRTEESGLRVTVRAGIHIPQAGDADMPLLVTEEDTAAALAFQDPSLMTVDKATAARVLDHIKGTSDFKRLAEAIKTFGPATSLDDQAKHHSGWAVSVASKDSKGNPITTTDPTTNQAFQATHWVTAGSPEYYAAGFHDRYIYVDGRRVVAPTPYAMAALVRGQARVAVHDDSALLGKMFTLQTDTTTRPLSVQASLGAEGKIAFAADDTQWKGDRRITVDHVEGRKVTFSVHNGGWRRQAVAVRFRDQNGKLIEKKNLDERPESEAYAYLDDTYTYSTIMGIVDGRFTVLGVPLSAETVEKYELTLPGEASSFEVVIGSAGFKQIDMPAYVSKTGGEPEPQIKTPGEVATGLLDVALPLMALAAGAGPEHLTKMNPLVTALASEGVKVGTSLLMRAIATGATGANMFSADYATELLTEVIADTPAIANALILWSIEVSAERALEAPLEMFAAILEAIEAAGTLVQIGETVGTVALNAPLVYDRVAASETMNVRVTPKDAYFSPYVSSVATYVYYGDSTVPTVKRQVVDMTQNHGNGPKQIDVVLPQQPVGGEVKVKVALESANGWVAGAGEVLVANDPDGSNTLLVPVSVEQNPTPIDAHTRYQHARVLTVKDDGSHAWREQSAPPAEVTPTVCNTGDTSRPWLCGAGSMTFNSDGVLGYSWTGSGVNLRTCDGASNVATSVAQSINLNPNAGDGTPDARLKRSPCGSLAPVYLAFDPNGSPTGGRHVFVQQVTETVNGAPRPVYEVFPLDIGTTGPIAPDQQTILGRFRSPHLDAIVMNPTTGVLLGLDKSQNAVEVLKISGPSTVANAPTSTVIGGAGKSVGRLHDAASVAFLPAGAGFLVLEAGGGGAAGRVQAFTFDGASVPMFGGQPSFALDARDQGVTYTDMKIDPTESYVYVSSYVGEAPTTHDFRLDIYRIKDGALVSRTEGVPLAKMAIDKWRDLYTLNNARIAPSLAEPSVSLWVAPPVEP
jgi:hypothetical protein